MSHRILIVDDETDTLKLLTLRLQKNGYETLTCETGKDALALVLHEKIDLIVLDIKLPDMNGYDALEKIRSYPKFENLPVIFSTADASVAVKKTARDYFANDFVIKPYDAQDLLRKIARLLKSS